MNATIKSLILTLAIPFLSASAQDVDQNLITRGNEAQRRAEVREQRLVAKIKASYKVDGHNPTAQAINILVAEEKLRMAKKYARRNFPNNESRRLYVVFCTRIIMGRLEQQENRNPNVA